MSERTLNLQKSVELIQVALGDEPEKAKALAQKLGLPVVEEGRPPKGEAGVVTLRYRDGKLQALSADQSGSQFVVEADFLQVSNAKRLLRARSELVVKAVQGRQKTSLTVLDATIGLGGDAMLIAAMGHQVIGLERAPLVYELVADGLDRAGQAGVKALPELVLADAAEWLTEQSDRQFDVIYLDPMFEASGKQALPRKQMP